LYKNELLQIILHDNGKGFLVEKTMANQTGLGLNNMQKRINLLNGKMNIESSSVAGTTIQFSIPYP
jgi:signal transduction histidine kinase